MNICAIILSGIYRKRCKEVIMAEINKTQKKIYEYLMERTQISKVPPSVREIAAAVGLKSTSSVQANLDALEQAGYIERDPMIKRSIRVCNEAENDYMQIPLVGTVTAGSPILAVEQIEGYIPYTGNVSKDRPMFALKVRGESMLNAGILSGDIVIVESCGEIPVGKVGIFLYNGESYIKKFGGDRLRSVNPKYDDIVFKDNDDVRCLGLVLGTISKEA